MRRAGGRAARWARYSWLSPGALALLLGTCTVPAARAQEFAPSLYIRTDSDHTTVVSPRARVRAAVAEETHVDFAYAVDIWTSASVDIVASASGPVTEQRDEIDVGADHVWDDLTLSAGYRYSHEPDFVSHGGHAGASLNLLDNNTTVAATLAFSADDVGRAGDPLFSRSATTFGVQTSLTQVLDQATILQLLYDFGRVDGYQGSPYRYVAIGGDGLCHGERSLCVQERTPNDRTRHAAALRLRRALGERWSAGAGYRLYGDSWGLSSHTFSANLSYSATATRSLGVQYRGYTQSAVEHYRARYESLETLRSYFTGDKELSPLSSHRVLLDWEESAQLDASTLLRFGLSVGPTFYAYRDYRFLTSMIALDATSWAMLEF